MNQIRQIVSSLRSHYNAVAGFFVIFYLVGITGMLIPFTFPLFVKLIPLALLLSAVGFLVFHTDFSARTWILFILIYLAGFFVEVVGVNTGKIFGNYSYGESLGITIFKTPLIIGINWLLLVYLTSSTTELLKVSSGIKIFLASGIMLGYDIIIEPLAPQLDMWTWANNQIPVRNYIAWFVLALIFTSLIKIVGVKTRNKLAPVLLVCQLLFFIILLVTFHFKH